jgi:hypothetical protein
MQLQSKGETIQFPEKFEECFTSSDGQDQEVKHDFSNPQQIIVDSTLNCFDLRFEPIDSLSAVAVGDSIICFDQKNMLMVFLTKIEVEAYDIDLLKYSIEGQAIGKQAPNYHYVGVTHWKTVNQSLIQGDQGVSFKSVEIVLIEFDMSGFSFALLKKGDNQNLSSWDFAKGNNPQLADELVVDDDESVDDL